MLLGKVSISEKYFNRHFSKYWTLSTLPCSTSFSMATSVPPSSAQNSWADVQFFQSLGPSGIFSKRHYKNIPPKHSFPYFSKWIKSFLNTPRISFENFLWQKRLFFSFFQLLQRCESKTRRTSFQGESGLLCICIRQPQRQQCFVTQDVRTMSSAQWKNSIPSKKKPASLQSLQGRISSKKHFFWWQLICSFDFIYKYTLSLLSERGILGTQTTSGI